MSDNKEFKEEDFLENDPEIPGQKYCCLSFISPEDVLERKDVFYVHKFLETMAKNYDLDRNKIQEKYKDFVYVNRDKFESEFYEQNDFRTTVRGLKVRGCYDTIREAEVRAKVLQRRDRNFNVFVAQVGFWLPWNPQSDQIENQEYLESELNTLVKKYKENQEKKEVHFQENIDYVKEQQELQNKKAQEAREAEAQDTPSIEEQPKPDEDLQKLEKELGDIDPWMKNKVNE